MMHEDCKKQNDRQRDSDKPEQSALSERHVSLHFAFYAEFQRTAVSLVPRVESFRSA